jgi:CO dehydrogenase/acetyl-CoA synthase gamma subunit (corrinoid Fe-S protein)
MFNIDVIGGNPDSTPIDQRIGDTIAHIMKLFFTNLDNVVVYVCDSVDERQLARKRKFDRWFYLYNDGSLLKEDGLAVVAGSEIYNSLLMHKQNKQLTEIILAFSDLNERSGEK